MRHFSSCGAGLSGWPPDILNRTARDFFVGALTPIILQEKVLDLEPNTLDEVLAAAQRYESNQKVLNKGSARVLSSTSGEREKFGSQQKTPEPPVWAKELFQQQAEILEKLKNIPQGRQGRNESVESGQGLRACYKCGSLTHFIRECQHQVRPDQGNGRWAGRSRKWPRPRIQREHFCLIRHRCRSNNYQWRPIQSL